MLTARDQERLERVDRLARESPVEGERKAAQAALERMLTARGMTPEQWRASGRQAPPPPAAAPPPRPTWANMGQRRYEASWSTTVRYEWDDVYLDALSRAPEVQQREMPEFGT